MLAFVKKSFKKNIIVNSLQGIYQNSPFFISLFYIFFTFFLFIFTITVTPNPYPQLVSGSQI